MEYLLLIFLKSDPVHPQTAVTIPPFAQRQACVTAAKQAMDEHKDMIQYWVCQPKVKK